MQAVFKMVPADAVRLIKTGKSVLEGWHNTYMQVREKIEVSGRDARWEFSKPMLFERTNYMAEICTDVSEMVEIVDDFHKFLGPELKAVTGDSQVCFSKHQHQTACCTKAQLPQIQGFPVYLHLPPQSYVASGLKLLTCQAADPGSSSSGNMLNFPDFWVGNIGGKLLSLPMRLWHSPWQRTS